MRLYWATWKLRDKFEPQDKIEGSKYLFFHFVSIVKLKHFQPSRWRHRVTVCQTEKPAATNAATKCQTLQPQAAALTEPTQRQCGRWRGQDGACSGHPRWCRGPRHHRSARRTAEIENRDAGEDGRGGERRGAGSGGAGMGEVAGRRRGPMAAVPSLQLAAEMDNTTFAIGPSSCTIEALQT